MQQQGNPKLVDRKEDVENDTNIVPDKEEDPYHGLRKTILEGICLIKKYLRSMLTCQIRT